MSHTNQFLQEFTAGVESKLDKLKENLQQECEASIEQARVRTKNALITISTTLAEYQDSAAKRNDERFDKLSKIISTREESSVARDDKRFGSIEKHISFLTANIASQIQMSSAKTCSPPPPEPPHYSRKNILPSQQVYSPSIQSGISPNPAVTLSIQPIIISTPQTAMLLSQPLVLKYYAISLCLLLVQLHNINPADVILHLANLVKTPLMTILKIYILSVTISLQHVAISKITLKANIQKQKHLHL